MSIARVGDIELYYEEHGTGEPLLCIKGLAADSTAWVLQTPDFAKRHRTIIYDNRGVGRSSKPQGPYSIAQMADDAAGLLDALGIERADVFGMSLGGMIAQELALRWPERVDRLVLGCTHCGVAHAARPDREAGRAFAMETDDWAERIRALAPFAFSAGVDGDRLARFVEKKAGDVQDPEGYRGQLGAALAHDTYDRLPEIGSPTLILTGDEDRVIPATSSDILHERIPGSRLEVIAGAGHLFFLERPDESLRLLRDFLGG